MLHYNMNDSELLAKFREQNRLRQSAFYEKNKEAVNARRREKYKASKLIIDEETKEPEPETQPQQPLAIVQQPQEKMKKTRLTKSSLTYDEAVSKLEKIIEVKATLEKYTQDLKRLISITGCNDIAKCLKKSKEIIEYVNHGTKKNGELYSTNTVKSLYQSILILIDKLELKINKKPYLNQFEILKIKSADENNKKNNEIIVPSFQTYLENVKNKFGENSKMFLIASLYNELTIRDDYILKIVTTKKNVIGDEINYLIVPPKASCQIIINAYKTEKKYGVIKHTCSKSLNNLIRKYMQNNHDNIGNSGYLFGDKTLTSFVSANNVKLNIKGGINIFRQMKITDELKNVASAEERKKLADSMRHSPVSQLKYVRQHNIE